jgi:membrane-associated phospholipid phosphatase
VKRPGVLGALIRLGAAAAIGAAARDKRVRDADEQVRAFVVSRRSPSLDKAMPAVTDLGSVYALGGAAAVLWAAGRTKMARDVAGAGLAAWLVAQGAKKAYKRRRPYEVEDVNVLVRTPSGTSYPSGHPAVAAAVARVLDPAIAQPARGAVARLPRVVAFSRVYVGVHYPTDVIGGSLVGRAIGDLWVRFTTKR